MAEVEIAVQTLPKNLNAVHRTYQTILRTVYSYSRNNKRHISLQDVVQGSINFKFAGEVSSNGKVLELKTEIGSTARREVFKAVE